MGVTRLPFYYDRNMPAPLDVAIIVYLFIVSLPLLGLLTFKYLRAAVMAGKAVFDAYRRRRAVEKRYRRLLGVEEKPTWSRAMGVITLYLLLGFVVISKTVLLAVVVSNSMAPTLHRGDLVLVQSFYTQPEVGDIIMISGLLVNDPGGREFVLHRVVEVGEEGVFTAGDAVGVRDPWVVKREMIAGKVVTIAGKPLVIPGVGEMLIKDPRRKSPREIMRINNLINFVRIYGFVLFLICLVLYAALEVRDIRRVGA